MDQINFEVRFVENEDLFTSAVKQLNDLELSLIGGGIGDTIL
jgi:hypothetical protein